MAEVVQLKPPEPGDDRLPVRRRVSSRYCGHRHVEVSEKERQVVCADCEAVLDPITALSMLASELERYEQTRDRLKREAEEAAVRLKDLKRQVGNAKAQLRRATR